jgi:class III poly(R)-hydroxyalkanoic acid synthase PhaE subunit
MTNNVHGQWWDQWLRSWQALAAPQRPTNPWAAALDEWASVFSPPSPTYADVLARMMAQGKSFFAFGDALGQSFEPQNKGLDVQALFLRSLENLKQGLEAQPWSAAAAPMASGLWQLPLESWQQTASILTGMPMDALHGAGGSASTLPWMQQQLEKIFTTPGLGYTREHQEQLQKLGGLVIAYQKAFNEYAVAYAEVGKRSIERVEARLKEREAAGEAPIDSTKELFDVWVDCSEEVYAEFVMSDDYVRLHGQMTNALMALKKQQRTILDDGFDAMNLPTRREMDTLLQRFQQMRRNEKALQSEIRALTASQQELKAGIAALRESPSARKKKKKTKPRAKKKRT